MNPQEGDTLIGPCFGTRYEVLEREGDEVLIRAKDAPIEKWTVRGLERLGYRKETSA